MKNQIVISNKNHFLTLPFEKAYDLMLTEDGNQEIVKHYVSDFFGVNPDFISKIDFKSNKKLGEIRFTKEVTDKTLSGEYQVQSNGTQVRKNGKFIPVNDDISKIWNKITMVAHVISSIDDTMKLDKIREGIENLTNFIKHDRIGILRGHYDTLVKIYSNKKIDNNQIIKISNELDVLEARF